MPTCCVISNPCLNGGSCTSPLPNSRKRFRCLCRIGFYGNCCETANNPRSCADFLTEKVKPLSGEYEIVDATGRSYSVYCDFDSEPGFAWTLLLSFSRDDSFSISANGLLEDLPINDDTYNWENYRLSAARMKTIREQSSHWRATCEYPVFGVDHKDYIRVNLSDVDFSAYYFNEHNGPTGCKTIEYMNILESECHQCNFALYQGLRGLPGLFLSWSSDWSYCTFDLSNKNYNCPDNKPAGLFISATCFDPRFRCHKTASSTTQNWFGSTSSLLHR